MSVFSALPLSMPPRMRGICHVLYTFRVQAQISSANTGIFVDDLYREVESEDVTMRVEEAEPAKRAILRLRLVS